MTCRQEQQLTRIITAAGFGASHLPPGHMDAITTAVGQAEEYLRVLLRQRTSREEAKTFLVPAADRPTK
jgi:hypothetical protein